MKKLSLRTGARSDERERLGVAERLLRMVRKRPPKELGFEEKLALLEERADGEVAGFEAFFYNRAGDLCLREGEARRALGYYGRAIDAYLRADRFEAAGAVCQKLLRTDPNAVRPRCTLVWVAIARGFESQAVPLVEQYVNAAFQAGKEWVAIQHLIRMARVCRDPALLTQIGEGLLSLGASGAADRTFGRAIAFTLGTGTDVGEVARRQAAVQAALLGPADIEMEEAA